MPPPPVDLTTSAPPLSTPENVTVFVPTSIVPPPVSKVTALAIVVVAVTASVPPLNANPPVSRPRAPSAAIWSVPLVIVQGVTTHRQKRCS